MLLFSPAKPKLNYEEEVEEEREERGGEMEGDRE